MEIKMKCSICNGESIYYHSKILLSKHKVKYFRCINCNFIETEKPRYWLKEAYNSPIIDADTGVISRNLTLSKIASLIHLFFLKKNAKVIDYAGGYGVMTRMLRDIGLDCFWQDKYATNLFAKHFNSIGHEKYNMVTAFEFFEHMDDPNGEVYKIVKNYSPELILFSTTIHNGNPPTNWWYYVEIGGQHISLYTSKSLAILAKNSNYYYSTNGVNLHMFSRKRIPNIFMIAASTLWPLLSFFLPLFYKSKTYSDHIFAVKQ